MKSKNIILIGPSGFLGPAILRKYEKIIAVGRKKPPTYCKNKFILLKNIYNLSKLNNIKIDYVIYLIGNSNHHKLNNSDLIKSLKYNFLPLESALNYFKNRKILKFVCFSGALLYDQKKLKLPCNEKSSLNPYKNNYIFSKFLAEKIVEKYKDIVPIINIRLSNIYGPSTLERPDIVISIMNRLLWCKNAQVYSFKPMRDFIHLDDVADAIIKLLSSDFVGNINLGTGKATSIKRVCDIIQKITKKKITSLNKKMDGPYKYAHDISLLKKKN